MATPLNFVYEDVLSEFVMTKLVNSFGDKYFIGNHYCEGGYGYIKKNINGFNEAAIATPFFVLADLDRNPCPKELIKTWLKKEKNTNLIFRIAVCEVEAWVLADIEGFSNFLGISSSHFPSNPELIRDPKQLLINLAGKSRRRDIREDITPINYNAKIGPNYNGRLMEFIAGEWSIGRAKKRSESLSRTYRHLETFQYSPPKNKQRIPRK